MKWILDFEGLYSIEEGGIVRSWKKGTGCNAPGTPLSPQLNSRGYCQVVLYGHNKMKRIARVHRLVAEAFLDNPEGLPQVDHIDKNKLNNSVENLRWVSNQQNSEHSLSKVYLLKNRHTGEIVKVFNLNKWCEGMGLHASSMNRMLAGHRKYYNSWMKGE